MYRIRYLKQNTRLTFLLSAATMLVAAGVALIKFKMNEWVENPFIPALDQAP